MSRTVRRQPLNPRRIRLGWSRVARDGKVALRYNRETGHARRESMRRWKAQCKAARQRDRDEPPEPRTEGWISW